MPRRLLAGRLQQHGAELRRRRDRDRRHARQGAEPRRELGIHEAANTPVPVTVLLKPHNAAASVTLTYTTDDFATTTPITCTRTGTSGNDDVWTATVPGQAAGLTVRFYYQALDYSSNAIYLPGSNINYTYVTQ